MAVCETCGTSCDEAFQVIVDGDAHDFDTFECAIEALAPRCSRCGCRIIGHGTEEDEKIYCCARCALEAGAAASRTGSERRNEWNGR